MEANLQSIETKQQADGSWLAVHTPSGQQISAGSEEVAKKNLLELLGADEKGDLEEPLTSDRFEGQAKEIAEYLEQDISKMLSIHLGFARLEAYQAGILQVRLGGGCEGCPSQSTTLLGVIKERLVDKFSEDLIIDIQPG